MRSLWMVAARAGDAHPAWPRTSLLSHQLRIGAGRSCPPRYDVAMEHELRAVGAVDLAQWHVVARFETLEDVARWDGGAIVDIVVQDEYRHDVIAATGTDFVVFDTT